MDIAISVHGVPIRLTDERWRHIVDRHPEIESHLADLLVTIREPEAVMDAGGGALLAHRGLNRAQHIVVLYREVSREDGFVITSLLTSRLERFLKRGTIWTRPSST